ncbi:SWIM zinc finger family protein [Rhodococcus sp. HNM0569]|uniref:SWIM zinc finger family protein n=1 Tax=Rhodococcus sp. HNM0569 TaxID=2716340 RepID=UPI00146DA301|nr:SWIM zinc finger family protein [Rhodococcus sp. HNM0569]NLU84433.1 hypothetical protein [Rhodococcus sp. HNM0569]
MTPRRSGGFAEYGTRRPVKGGVTARSKRGGFGTTAVGRAFADVVERVGERGRMSRGRSYARSGQVVALRIEPGAVVGEVQGSQLEPFTAVVSVRPFDADTIDDLVRRVRREPGSLAVLASGAFPESFLVAALPDDSADIAFDCTCPDDGWPCKHAAALAYLAAERIDTDPLQLLALRGLPLDDLIAAVDARSAGIDDGTDASDDWFGDRVTLPPLPAPRAVAAPDDLDPLLLRGALRTFCVDEREVDAVMDELALRYEHLG